MSPKFHSARTLGRFLHACLGVACLFTLIGFLGGVSWVGHVFEHFRLQYIGIAISAAAFYLWQKRLVWAGTAAFVCFMNGAAVHEYLGGNILSVASHGVDQSVPLKVMSINVLMVNENKQGVVDYILDEKPDIVAVIEVNDHWAEALQQLRRSYPYEAVEALGGNFGIALFSRHPIRNAEVSEIKYIPMLTAGIHYRGRWMFVMAVHAFPPVEPYLSLKNLRQLEGYASILDQHQGQPVLVLGDFNQTPWSSRMLRFRKVTQLLDSAAHFAYRPSWPTHALWLAGIRVDHILHSKHFLSQRAWTGPFLGSDHLPVLAEFLI